MGNHLTGYRCVVCGSERSASGIALTCEACGGNLDALYDYEVISREWSREQLAADPDPSLWRYLPLLPVDSVPDRKSIRVGGTPLESLGIIAEKMGLGSLWVKDDSRNPSTSLKDRASEVGIRHAIEADKRTIVVASTGNAAASLSALSAWHGVNAIVVAPAAAPPAKLTQIVQYVATLCPVAGSYDDAFDLSLKLAENRGWYLRSTGVNPVMTEGKKTVAFEIAEQLGWKMPDAILVPVGDGCIIGGVHKGFRDLKAIGWIDRIPRIIAVQAEGSSAIADAVARGGEILPVKANTIADSISVDLPRDGVKAVRAVTDTGGAAIKVSDDEILVAQHDLASSTGLFAEPAASAAWAGFHKAVENKIVRGGENVVVLITGSGLKDIPAAQKKVSIPAPIKATEEGLNEYLSSLD